MTIKNAVGQRWTFIAGVLMAGSIGGLLGGFNMHWSRQPAFPIYGIGIDLIAVPALIALILYMRRVKIAMSDEFSVAKKRFAAQTGLMIGFLLFALSGVFPIVFKGPYNQFIASMDGANDGFIFGRLFGMLPFVFGLLIGQIAAWRKYR